MLLNIGLLASFASIALANFDIAMTLPPTQYSTAVPSERSSRWQQMEQAHNKLGSSLESDSQYTSATSAFKEYAKTEKDVPRIATTGAYYGFTRYEEAPKWFERLPTDIKRVYESAFKESDKIRASAWPATGTAAAAPKPTGMGGFGAGIAAVAAVAVAL